MRVNWQSKIIRSFGFWFGVIAIVVSIYNGIKGNAIDSLLLGVNPITTYIMTLLSELPYEVNGRATLLFYGLNIFSNILYGLFFDLVIILVKGSEQKIKI